MTEGFLARALPLGRVTLVDINKVSYQEFFRTAHEAPYGLGVRGLSACSVVILASKRAAIVAHIGPNIPGSSDPNSYILLAQQKMIELSQLYQQNHKQFKDDTKPYVIVATFEGNILTQAQMDIMVRHLTSMGFAHVPVVHRPLQPSVSDSEAAGTVLVFGNRVTFKVLLEDQDITEEQSEQEQAAATNWMWDSTRRMWYYVDSAGAFHWQDE